MEIDHSGTRICCLLLRTLIKPPQPSLLPFYVLSLPSSYTVLPQHGNIFPLSRHLYPSQNTKKTHSPPPSHLSSPESDSSAPTSPSPRLPDSYHRRSPADSNIYLSVVFSCRSAAVRRHHCLHNPPLAFVPRLFCANL